MSAFRFVKVPVAPGTDLGRYEPKGGFDISLGKETSLPKALNA